MMLTCIFGNLGGFGDTKGEDLESRYKACIIPFFISLLDAHHISGYTKVACVPGISQRRSYYINHPGFHIRIVPESQGRW